MAAALANMLDGYWVLVTAVRPQEREPLMRQVGGAACGRAGVRQCAVGRCFAFPPPLPASFVPHPAPAPAVYAHPHPPRLQVAECGGEVVAAVRASDPPHVVLTRSVRSPKYRGLMRVAPHTPVVTPDWLTASLQVGAGGRAQRVQPVGACRWCLHAGGVCSWQTWLVGG